jgi:hypothetical protein
MIVLIGHSTGLSTIFRAFGRIGSGGSSSAVGMRSLIRVWGEQSLYSDSSNFLVKACFGRIIFFAMVVGYAALSLADSESINFSGDYDHSVVSLF